MKFCSYAILILFMFTAPAFADVYVSSPGNGATVGSPVNFSASASTGCSNGIASMGVYVNNSLKYVGTGSSLNTSISLGAGSYYTVIQEWDNCGGSTTAARSITVSGSTGVYVSSPANNSTVGSPANYVATASTTCPQGVAAMGIYVNGVREYVVGGDKLNTQLSMGAGTQHTVVQEWDHCGGSTATPVTVNVQGSSSTASGNTLYNLQTNGGWQSYGQIAPNFVDCSPSPCNNVAFSHELWVQSPSYDGKSTRYTLGGWNGKAPYGDVLFTMPLIGYGSTVGLPDWNKTILPNVHNLTYDTNLYVTNMGITQALEFDLSLWLGNNQAGMTFGTECNHLGDGNWDVWDNGSSHWIDTGAPCTFHNGWNHVTIQLQRLWNNYTLYKSITVNGQTFWINRSYPPRSCPWGWYGLNINYQMDGNYDEAPNATYLDNTQVSYW